MHISRWLISLILGTTATLAIPYTAHTEETGSQFSSWKFSSYKTPGGDFYCSVISAVENKNIGQNIIIKGQPSSDHIVIDLYNEKWNRKQGSFVNVIFDFENNQPLTLPAYADEHILDIELPAEHTASLLLELAERPSLQVIFPDDNEDTWTISRDGAKNAVREMVSCLGTKKENTGLPASNKQLEVADMDQQQNAICYVKANEPDLVFGQLPFSCDEKPEKFVSYVKQEIEFLSKTTIIPNLDQCLTKLFEPKNMTNVARGVWDLRESPIMSTSAAAASSISDACKEIVVSHNNDTPESFPANVEKTWRYKPFSIVSTANNKQMSDAYIANIFMCRTPESTLQETMDLINNYDVVDTSKTDGTLTLTSFRGKQEAESVTVSLAVDEQSSPRLVRYVLVNGMPVFNCK